MTATPPKSSLKKGTYKGSSLIIGVGSSSFSSQKPATKASPMPTKILKFKTVDPKPVSKKPGVWDIKPLTITPAKFPVVSSKKSSSSSGSGGSSSSGNWKGPVPKLGGTPLNSDEKLKKGLSNTNKWQVGSDIKLTTKSVPTISALKNSGPINAVVTQSKGVKEAPAKWTPPWGFNKK